LLEFSDSINWLNKSEVGENVMRLELRLRGEDTSDKIKGWNVTEMGDDYILIQIKWENKLLVSPDVRHIFLNSVRRTMTDYELYSYRVRCSITISRLPFCQMLKQLITSMFLLN